jgi:hypothetical protein
VQYVLGSRYDIQYCELLDKNRVDEKNFKVSKKKEKKEWLGIKTEKLSICRRPTNA